MRWSHQSCMEKCIVLNRICHWMSAPCCWRLRSRDTLSRTRQCLPWLWGLVCLCSSGWPKQMEEGPHLERSPHWDSLEVLCWSCPVPDESGALGGTLGGTLSTPAFLMLEFPKCAQSPSSLDSMCENVCGLLYSSTLSLKLKWTLLLSS